MFQYNLPRCDSISVKIKFAYKFCHRGDEQRCRKVALGMISVQERNTKTETIASAKNVSSKSGEWCYKKKRVKVGRQASKIIYVVVDVGE